MFANPRVPVMIHFLARSVASRTKWAFHIRCLWRELNLGAGGVQPGCCRKSQWMFDSQVMMLHLVAFI